MVPSSMILFVSSSLSLTNGKLLYDYLAFVGFLDTESKIKTSFMLVSGFAHVAQTIVLYPLHVVQTRLNADIGITQKNK